MSERSTKLQDLLETKNLPDLGPGPRSGVASLAEVNKKLDQVLPPLKLPARNQQLVRALVLLWHDHLDASHKIAQDIEGADGAFVHGIMHRREPDFGNAAYWFRRVGAHAAFPRILERATSLDAAKSDAKLNSALLSGGAWDPFAFIHLCEEYLSASDDPSRKLLQQIQAAETSVLLDHFCG